MNVEGQEWFNKLRQHFSTCRREDPLLNRDELTTEQEMQYRIIGGSFITWLERHGPDLIQERWAILGKMTNMEKDPFIVFTSSTPGLVAAREILGESAETVVFLRPDEFVSWLKRNPDAEYRWHIHTWSYFADSLDSESHAKARKYPLGVGELHWLHHEGTMCAKHFGRGGDHLWRWNGTEPSLLEECLNQWVS